MYTISSDIILISIGIIIVLEGFVLFRLMDDKISGIFAGIYGSGVLGYGLYLRIVRNDAASSLHTKRQKQLIKLLYGVSGLTMLVGANNMWLYERKYKFPARVHKNPLPFIDILELGTVDVTYQYQSASVEREMSWICKKYLIRSTNEDAKQFKTYLDTIQSKSSSNNLFTDYLKAFCEYYSSMDFVVVVDNNFFDIVEAFRDLSRNNAITETQFLDIVGQIAVADISISVQNNDTPDTKTKTIIKNFIQICLSTTNRIAAEIAADISTKWAKAEKETEFEFDPIEYINAICRSVMNVKNPQTATITILNDELTDSTTVLRNWMTRHSYSTLSKQLEAIRQDMEKLKLTNQKLKEIAEQKNAKKRNLNLFNFTSKST